MTVSRWTGVHAVTLTSRRNNTYFIRWMFINVCLESVVPADYTQCSYVLHRKRVPWSTCHQCVTTVLVTSQLLV